MRPLLLAGHTRPLTRVKYNRKGDLLVTSARDNSANLWWSHNGERIGTFDGHNGSILDIDIDRHSKYLLTASADMTAKLWELKTGAIIKEWEFKTPVRAVAFAMGDDRFMAVTDARMGYPATLYVFSMTSLSDRPLMEQALPTSANVTVAEWADLNRFIYTGHENGTICTWDPDTGDKLDEKRVHKGKITDLQLSLDKTYLITASKDFTAKILDAQTLRELKVFTTSRAVNSAALSPIYEQIALGGGQEAADVTTVGSDGKFEVRFFHRIYQEEMARVKGHFGPINTIAFNPDGKSFTSGGEDGYVRVHHFDKSYFDWKD